MGRISETDLIINPDGSIYHLNLKRQNLSEKIITVGDPGRVKRITRHFDQIEFEINKREFITQTGTYQGKRLTVMSTGMGTDNVEIVMNELDAIFNIDLETREPKSNPTKLTIIRVGTSGSIREEIPVGSHVMAKFGIGLDPLIHFYEMNYSAQEQQLTEALKQQIALPYSPYIVQGSERLHDQFKDLCISGNTATCLGFYAPQGRELRMAIKYPDIIDRLAAFQKDDFQITNLEMETAGYYALSRLLGHEMISLNAILANRARKEFATDAYAIVDKLILKVLETI